MIVTSCAWFLWSFFCCNALLLTQENVEGKQILSVCKALSFLGVNKQKKQNLRSELTEFHGKLEIYCFTAEAGNGWKDRPEKKKCHQLNVEKEERGKFAALCDW